MAVASSSIGTPILVKLARFNRAFRAREVSERACEQAKDEWRAAEKSTDRDRAVARLQNFEAELVRAERAVSSTAEGVVLELLEQLGRVPGEQLDDSNLASAFEASLAALKKVG